MVNSGQIVALHNNDVVFLAWRYAEPIDGCLGFSIRRKELSGGKFAPLPAWVGWEGGDNPDWKAENTDIWPVQKFNWRDFTAKPGGQYQYQVVPMIGRPENLEPDLSLALASKPVSLTPDAGEGLKVYFNNGILSTQHVSHMLPSGASGAPNYRALGDHIRKVGDELRLQLAGQMIDALKELLDRAKKDGGECCCALYELDDPELIKAIIDSKDLVHIILSDTDTNEGQGKSREQLHRAHVDITDRMLKQGHIGHNKFVVYVDRAGKPAAVLAGSTNWTSTGLCAQSNNTVIVSDPKIAGFYFDYWNRMKTETDDADGDPGQLQTKGFRKENNRPRPDADNTVWFSPNTQTQTKPKSATLTSGTPGDVEEMFKAIEGAKQAILFLEFQPGTPSVLDKIKEVESDNPTLFIRGAATDSKAIQKFDEKNPITTELYHRSTTGEPDKVYETGVAATAINDEFAYWKRELLKSSPTAHAIIHDKIVVVDPLSDNCVVMMGSHNQGYKASYCNDENLIIFRGNRALAEAYTTHVMDIYDHYRWRYSLQEHKAKGWTGLKTTADWQDRYFQPGNMAYQELDFWLPSKPAAAGKAAALAARAASGGKTLATTTKKRTEKH